ncbi:hypothetical protein [Helicobacter bilis]|nr:hypothetical protein [Helicobacter bilis]
MQNIFQIYLKMKSTSILTLVIQSIPKDNRGGYGKTATQKENIPINWIHTDSSGNYSEKISREKALEMKNAYGMKYIASITSNHILGKAIDMTITWIKDIKIKDKAGKEYILTPNNGIMVLNAKNFMILEQPMESISC